MTDINDSIRKRGFRGDNPQARIDADILNGLVMFIKTCERRQPGGILPKEVCLYIGYKEFEALSAAEGLSVTQSLSVNSFLDIPVILVDKPTFRRLAVTL